LDSLISEALENKKNFQLLGIFRAKIADGLNDFYNIRSQNKAQVSGINWIIYGQHCMGIDRLYDSIKERIESLEIYYDIYMKSAAYQITAGLSLLSVFLAATASSQIMDMIAKIPMFQQYHIDNWKWLPSIILFLLFVTISVTTFVRSNKLVKHL
jgi:hypothetical protein